MQVRNPEDLENVEGVVLPGGESTAMGLIGTSSARTDGKNMWDFLKEFTAHKPTWGTCAGMILLSERCVGTSAVIENGQALVGGMDMLVCRNYFGSQISSFEMDTPAPPPISGEEEHNKTPYPGVYIRAPAILSAGSDVQILGKVVATPCRQAAVVLSELERRIDNGENVGIMRVVDALERKSPREIDYIEVEKINQSSTTGAQEEEKKDVTVLEGDSKMLVLPGAANGSNAREVICAVRKDNLLCTAFHPELTDDYRWHSYFVEMVREFSRSGKS